MAGVVGRAEVGLVTSAIYSPRLEKNIGFAWLPNEIAEPGSSVRVASEWGERNATVVEMPFVDPKKTIPVSYAPTPPGGGLSRRSTRDARCRVSAELHLRLRLNHY